MSLTLLAAGCGGSSAPATLLTEGLNKAGDWIGIGSRISHGSILAAVEGLAECCPGRLKLPAKHSASAIW